MGTSVMRHGRFELSYDRDADALYLSIGPPREAYTDEEEHGLLLRRDPRTKETVGVTILDYEEHFRHLSDFSWLARKPLPKELIAYLKER
ncbi:MAG: DUF2283 domain-containing protein, partial [Candidatus Binatia bacterium]